MATATEVVKKFFIASVFMWVFPIAIIYGFQHNVFPGLANLSPYHHTLLGGFLAVISINVVIAVYICMAMKEPSVKHEPDPTFVAKAKASINNQAEAGTNEKED